MPIELVAQGNENRLNFSLSLDPVLLLSPQFTLGADATNATLTRNTSQAAQGRHGITILLPQGQTFSAGTRQILVMQAAIPSGLPATTTAVDFGDSPTLRRVADANNSTLGGSYTPATVTIVPAAQGFEGDVSPRPNGSGGTVTISDWVQTGRFTSGLDTLTAGSEFQRADTAPRDTRGDGRITIADWVQTGRYAAGLDPIVPAGGPTAPSSSLTELRIEDRRSRIEDRGLQPNTIFNLHSQIFNLRSSIFDLQSSILDPRSPIPDPRSSILDPRSSIYSLQSQTRTVRVANAVGQRGQQVTVTIELDSQGGENALGFSLNFNPNDLALVAAALGADANVPNAMFLTNPTDPAQATNGRIGVLLTLPSGQSFAAGVKKLVNLTFNIPSSGSVTTIPITFGDQPVAREVVDASAMTLQATFTSGAVLIPGSVNSVSAATFAPGELASEQIIAAFGGKLATMTALGADSDPAPGIQLPTQLVGTTVSVRDSLGMTRLAPLFYVSDPQVNYLVPAGTAAGAATVTITGGDGSVSTGNVTIAAVAPGIFTANSNGRGVPSGYAIRVKPGGAQTTEPILTFDQATGAFVPLPIDLGPQGDVVVLVLFGTGWRAAVGNPNNRATIRGVDATPGLFLGPQVEFVGLDQTNIVIPRSLAQSGEVDLVLTAAGKNSNTVRVNIR